MLESEIAYSFDSPQKASRFIAHINSGSVPGVEIRLYTSSRSVLATYNISAGTGFDTTCAELDDLASSLGGVEIAVAR